MSVTSAPAPSMMANTGHVISQLVDPPTDSVLATFTSVANDGQLCLGGALRDL